MSASTMSSPSPAVVTPSGGSAHQTMESSIVDMMNTIVDVQMAKANRRREEERRKRVQQQQLIQQQQMQLHAATPDSGIPRVGGVVAGGAHARTSSMTSSFPQPVQPIPPPIDPLPPAPTSSAFNSFLSHFHLLTHLLAQLPISSLEHLIHFLQPSYIEQLASPPSMDLSPSSSSPTTLSTNAQQGGGAMSFCFPLFDATTQIQLIELLIKAYLQLIYLREKSELDQLEEEEYWLRKQHRLNQLSAGDSSSKDANHGEGEPMPGEPSSTIRSVPTSPSASALCQLRLLHVLRAYSGQYRLSYIIHRCVDYQNWLACAVAMENCVGPNTTRSTDDSLMQTRLPTTGLLIASGSIPDLHLAYVADAMECRLKHMDQRVETWNEWKRKRAADPLDHTPCPATAKSCVPVLIKETIPKLPPDVWLSFDDYAIESGQILMQLVGTHLIRISTVSEQARLIALLMRSWRQWDLPSLVLESIFLSHLASIADALSMLAFQKPPVNNPSAATPHSNSLTSPAPVASAVVNPHNFSTNSELPEEVEPQAVGSHSMQTNGRVESKSVDGAAPVSASAAPIFSAKLYLALTHYRLNQIYRSNQSSMSGGSSSSSGSNSALRPAPSQNHLHRLWSEILANLNRDLDGTSNSGATSTATDNSNNFIIFKQVTAPTPINTQPMSTPRTGSSIPRSSKDYPPQIRVNVNTLGSDPRSRSFVVFTCGHSYTHQNFFTTALPELFIQLATLTPPIPITTKFLQVEYQTMSGEAMEKEKDADEDDDDDENESNGDGPSGNKSRRRRRVVSLACPSCVFSTLLQLHQRHEKLRQQTNQKAQLFNQQQASWQRQQSLLAASSAGTASSLGTSPAPTPSSRSLTPTLYSGPSSAPLTHGATTFSFIQQTNQSQVSSSTDISTPPAAAAPVSTSPGLPVTPPSTTNSTTQRHRIGLSMTGNIPKLQFGRVSRADLENE